MRIDEEHSRNITLTFANVMTGEYELKTRGAVYSGPTRSPRGNYYIKRYALGLKPAVYIYAAWDAFR